MPGEDAKRNLFKRDVRKDEDEDYDPEAEGEDAHEEIEIDITSHGERPSVRAKLSLAAKAGVSTRPRIPAESPCLYRVYNATSQRLPLELGQLNSAAAYVVICDDDNRVTIWLGSTCSDSDITYAKDLALEVFRRDMRNYDATEVEDIVWEGREAEQPDLLIYILDQCGSDEGTYRGKKIIAERRNEIANQPICMCLVEKAAPGFFELTEVGYASPNDLGTISRIPFSPIELDSIVVSNVSHQWDIWISRGNSQADEESVTKYVINLAAAAQGVDYSVASRNVRIVRQGCERVTYRRYFKVLTDFEPPGRTVPWLTTEHKKDDGKSAAPYQRSKRFDLDADEDDAYGEPMVDSSYTFINEVFGDPSVARMDSWSGRAPVNPHMANGMMINDDIPRSIASDSQNQNYNQGENPNINQSLSQNNPNLNNQNINQNMYSERDEKQRAMGGGPPQEIYVSSADVYQMEPTNGIELDVETYPIMNQPITKLTEGRALINRGMLDFEEEELISPEQRLQLFADACVDPGLLVGWQVKKIALFILTFLVVFVDLFCNFFSTNLWHSIFI